MRTWAPCLPPTRRDRACQFAQRSLRLTAGPSFTRPRCLCLDAFEGDGFSCTPSDPCSRPDRGGCSENVSLAPALKA